MNAGSFFLAEIRRMVSSFSPRGAASTSTSVTNPYLYSWLAKASIVLVEVLIMSPVASIRGCSPWQQALGSSGSSAQGRGSPAGQLGEQRLHLPIPIGAEDDVGYTLLHNRTRIHLCAGRDREDWKAWSELFYGGNQQQASQAVGSQVQDDEIGRQRPHGCQQLHSGVADGQPIHASPETIRDRLSHGRAVRTQNDVHAHDSLRSPSTG